MDRALQPDPVLTNERIAALLRRSARTEATLAGVQQPCAIRLARHTLVSQNPRLAHALTRRLQEQLVDLRAAIELLEDGIGA
jgi:hypothetical protein